jgi:uncharacterized protein YegP (UPF0339 family)
MSYDFELLNDKKESWGRSLKACNHEKVSHQVPIFSEEVWTADIYL